MKLITYIICLVIMLSTEAMAQTRKSYKFPLNEVEQLAKFHNSAKAEKHQKIELLKEIKYHILNGRLEQAKLLLKEAQITTDFSKQVQYRYLAIIHFIEGNYKKVVELLDGKDMSDFSAQAKVCHLNILSRLIINDTKNLKGKWKECQKVLLAYSNTNLLWLKTIVDLKLDKKANTLDELFDGISIDNLSGDYLRLYLKLALYLNKQKNIIPRFEYFNQKTLEDSIFRELMGMNYYRNIELVKAFQLLDGLATPNAEVFKGNLYLVQKRFDDAFAQYKLALNSKDDSANALERLIPLSWKLQRWNEGIEFIKKFEFTEVNKMQKHILLAAFYTMSDQTELARSEIKNILGKTNKSEPIELFQILAYNAIYFDETYNVENTATSSCHRKDGINCWYLFFHNNWYAPTETLKDNKPIHPSENLFSYYTSQQRDEPLEEEIFVDQKDIEELDNNLLKLIKIK